MLSARKLGAVAAAGTAAALMATAGSAAARQVSHAAGQVSGGANVFVQTDNAAGNQIVAYHRNANGTVGKGGSKIDVNVRHGDISIKKGDMNMPPLPPLPRMPSMPKVPPVPPAPPAGPVKHLRPSPDAKPEPNVL